ncbi:MAG TPA: MEDS domain-containing protein [Pseudonocardiaceae bacterium]|nr:MEDS domain-containing protein [Pseudonocardiaceae bacterium]
MIPYQRQHRRSRRPNGYVLLDGAWAERLGVQRTGGLYRIGRRELADRLARLSATMPLADHVQGWIRSLTANEPQGDELQRDDIVARESHSHVVGFYETEAFLVDSVRDFLAPSLLAGDAAIVVATASHRDLFGRALREAGIDLGEAQRCGRYIALDASEALSKFMVEGMPDTARFRAVMGKLVSLSTEGPHDVRIYGEMVAVLWDQGNVAAAIALEDLWNDLATGYPFSLFCAYPIRAFDADASAEPFRKICGQHSKVIPTVR